ncbi:hypothetical protein DFJ73DRAFT_893391 [Zopfochytrium polystomum]|nr:hypothetical protein DFJ73DRAFT_893391 [Zopfochytrium polystomum]
MAKAPALPFEVLVDIAKAVVDVDDSWQTTCRIECSLFLIARLRLVSHAWRAAVESDPVARHAFGDCRPLGEDVEPEEPTTEQPRCGRSGSQRRYVAGYPAADKRVGAWHLLVDHEAYGSHWCHQPDSWPSQIYRNPGVRHWRCGRVSAVECDFVAVPPNGKRAALHHGGDDCAPPGGWFDLLVDFTLVSWCRAKMDEAMFDDGIGGYYVDEKASVPVMFSNQCAAVLERLRNAAAAEDGKSERAARRRRPRIVDRAVFDIATANAVRDLDSCHRLGFTCIKGYAGPSRWHGQASSVCERNCAFCAAAIDRLWLVSTLLRRFERFAGFDDWDGSASGDSGGPTSCPSALFYAESVEEFENYPYHAYIFTTQYCGSSDHPSANARLSSLDAAIVTSSTASAEALTHGNTTLPSLRRGGGAATILPASTGAPSNDRPNPPPPLGHLAAGPQASAHRSQYKSHALGSSNRKLTLIRTNGRPFVLPSIPDIKMLVFLLVRHLRRRQRHGCSQRPSCCVHRRSSTPVDLTAQDAGRRGCCRRCKRSRAPDAEEPIKKDDDAQTTVKRADETVDESKAVEGNLVDSQPMEKLPAYAE